MPGNVLYFAVCVDAGEISFSRTLVFKSGALK